MEFEVRTSQEADGLVVTPVGELDIATVDRVASVIEHRDDGAGVVIDLSQLTFLDTSGIQLVVQVFRDARAQGFPLRILPGPERVQRVFEIAGLDRVLPFA